MYPTRNLEGRPHIVVPVVMGVVGVWAGSNGPLLYPKEELQKSVTHWNGRPCVAFHPRMQSKGIAGDPDVFNRQKIGMVFNTTFDAKAGKLKAEAWLDPERMRAVDPRILAAVQKGEAMEVSTGLFTDNEQTNGAFGGVTYNAIARNHRPDHLAILPDQKGACSVAMGAGLCRNSYPGPIPLRRPAMMFA